MTSTVLDRIPFHPEPDKLISRLPDTGEIFNLQELKSFVAEAVCFRDERGRLIKQRAGQAVIASRMFEHFYWEYLRKSTGSVATSIRICGVI